MQSCSIPSDKVATLQQRMAAVLMTEADLHEKFVRGSGSGGQKINKTSNCVFLKHVPSGICVKCQMDRSREMNRFLARSELCQQLERIRESAALAETQTIKKRRRQNRPRSRNSTNRSVTDKRILSLKKSFRRPSSRD
jgi:protein subunit release factor B